MERPTNHHTIYGVLFILMAILLLLISIIFGAHEISGVLSIIAIVILLLFEGVRLLTENTHHKRIHDRFDEMERLFKKFKE